MIYKYTKKTVSLNQRNISLIYGQRKNFIELKKVLLIQKKFRLTKEIDLFTLKKILLNQKNFLQFKEIFSLTAYQRNCFLGVFASNNLEFPISIFEVRSTRTTYLERECSFLSKFIFLNSLPFFL